MSIVPVCWASAPLSAPRWRRWLERAPALVAEALPALRDPLPDWLSLPPAAPRAVAAALAGALLPPEAPDPAPAWLRADQRLSFARAVAAVRRYGGALLADATGTGKTWIALGVARALDPLAAVHVLAPAALLPQWRQVAARLGVAIRPFSYETLSRGRAPSRDPGPVLCDESHRLRTPSTRRYATLCRWCAGRPGLLLSATPVVNTPEDLGHQLLLFVRDDALRWAGLPGLRALPDRLPLAALGELVVTGEDRIGVLPASTSRDLRPTDAANAAMDGLRTGILSLRLSPDRGVAALVRTVLLSALASSPLAAAAALRRYRQLLQHGEDAAGAGRRISRQVIRRLAGPAGEQLVMWPLVAESSEPAELAFEDLPAVERLEGVARGLAQTGDAKVAVLRSIITDRKTTLVFSRSPETVHYLRRWLGRSTAWCTGHAAGLDALPASREVVLDWFRQPDPSRRVGRPSLLLATDVAAEGLDLPAVERVVHYDLPWTAVRLAQRSGRALRLGSRHRAIDVVRLLPDPELEGNLRQLAILDRKVHLPDRVGLGMGRTAPWRARAEVAARWQAVPSVRGVARIVADHGGLVAGFRLGMSDGTAREVVRMRRAGEWSDDPAAIARLLELAEQDSGPSSPPTAASVTRQVAALVRHSLRASNGQDLLSAGASPVQRRLRRRLTELVRRAVRRRDLERLRWLNRGLALLHRGLTAGEAAGLEEWIVRSDAELLAALRQLPEPEPRARPEQVELIGLLLVEPGRRRR